MIMIILQENMTFTVKVHAEGRSIESPVKDIETDALIKQRNELEKFVKQLEEENRYFTINF